jgi:hypothetical protein
MRRNLLFFFLTIFFLIACPIFEEERIQNRNAINHDTPHASPSRWEDEPACRRAGAGVMSIYLMRLY